MVIYEAYNVKTGKSYIRLTTKTLNKRKQQHLQSAKRGSQLHFHKALRKHGHEVFEWHVMLRCETLEDLYKAEIMTIGMFEDWQTYNSSKGGKNPAYGMRHTQEVKDLCGEYAKVRWDGKRASDKYPSWVFELSSYKGAKKFGIPKTTWYRERRRRGLT